jgi:hypothetical protein
MPGAAIGLGWRLNDWGGRRIVGHDGDTVGQSAYLRIDPEARVAACLLTNSAESESLFRELFNEVFGSLVGVTMPAVPRPGALAPEGAGDVGGSGGIEGSGFTGGGGVFVGRGFTGGSGFTGGLELGLAQHAGRYERTSRRFDVSVRDGQLHIVLTMTGNLADLTNSEPEELILYPADPSGSRFLMRSHDDEPWVPLSFGQLADGTPYLYLSGRVTPRVG